MTPTTKAKTRPPNEAEFGAHDTSLNIEQRLLAIMADLDYVQRDRVAPKEIGGFSFVSHDAVTSAVRAVCIKHGVLPWPTIIDHQRDGNQTTLIVDTTFANVDRPEDVKIIRSVGYGIDKQDKGPGKAYSYAVKYGYLKAFSLETGDDAEASSIDRTTGEIGARSAPKPAPRPAGTAAANHHTPGRPALAKFWAVARGQKVPEEVIRAWFKRNLGIESTKDADDTQLVEAATWAQAINGRQAKLGAAIQQTGMDARTIVDEAGRMFGGVNGLGELTLREWGELIDWAQAQGPTSNPAGSDEPGDDDIPF